MNALTEWVKDFLFLILAFAFLEILLPVSNLRQFVKWLMGLVIITFILQPLVHVESHLNGPQWDQMLKSRRQSSSVESILTAGERVAEGGEQPVLELMDQEQSRQIRSMLLIMDGVEDAEVVTQKGPDGDLQRVIVSVKSEADWQSIAAPEDEPSVPLVNVQDVEIGVPPQSDGSGSIGTDARDTRGALQKKVRRFIAANYRLPESAVKVIIE